MVIQQQSELTLVGSSAASDALRDEVDFAARADAKVLVTGETGVGKDLVARLIHHTSRRRLAPMATINCAGLPETLLESELFGHVRGSFTDACRDKAGIFESAANGTVFLDEVGEMSARMQAILLRFLETGELQRVGADRVHARVNVRVISATNRDLMTEIKAGRFREDLFYRLNVLRIHVAPLRERRDDIPALLNHYLQEYSRRHGAGRRELSPEVVARLSDLDWPGNVRQLKNVVERMVVKSTGPTIELRDLPRDAEFSGAPRPAETASTRSLVDRSVVPNLMARMLDNHESFWAVVHAPFMDRDLTRAHLMEVIARGLERSGGNYRSLVSLFNMPHSDYKRFLTFLSSHRCHVRFQTFRTPSAVPRGPVRVAPAAGREAQAVGF
ncbi:MAG TPA: sigma-54 dependent transcriptional regulator [Vicinamibacterales bacterium]|jgi:two-component system nitrogen regulation response regulator NtrX|nr:sigma-54 dependent transcriptional regulator [Vicinamibacterales bacterium]